MDQRLAEERRIKYRGTAMIRLEFLDFPYDESRELDPKNVERLKKCFRTEGCHRLELENHIPAIVEPSALNSALQIAGKSSDDLLIQTEESYTELKFLVGYRLACLHGQHRIQAGREYLSRRDAWWIVDLYLAGKSLVQESVESFLVRLWSEMSGTSYRARLAGLDDRRTGSYYRASTRTEA